ncbi:MAG TPA: hypothetical protein VIF11_09445 [Methylomirabilota bacterium]|jgi:hypothetical protein
MERTTTSRTRRRRRAPKATTPPAVAAAPSEPLASLVPPVPALTENPPALPVVDPEPVFATRVPPPAPERLRPATRHAIFFDVENTSNPTHIERVVGRLAIDHAGRSTEFFAVGNWRVIGHETGRVLARFGAQLMHSAPSTGVRDWSDLRIAVSAGVWLAGARPGDVLEIVSDDRAFDAVGDVAAALGITFHRLTARALAGAAPVETSRPAAAGDRGRRRGRRGRRGGRPGGADAEPHRLESVRSTPAPTLAESDEAHTAPHDELVLLVRELAERSPNGAVLIDNVARTLKARGFSRPPGSPRLVTRLRRIKELSVSPTGMISLVPGAVSRVEPRVEAPPPEPVVEDVVEAEEAAPAAAPKRGRRRSRRGGRRRRRSSPASGA